MLGRRINRIAASEGRRAHANVITGARDFW
jgi:hypothetical protein